MSVLSGRHGYYNTSVYNLWRNIIKRCEDANCEQYQWYGGRGIRMDDVWRKNPKAFCDWAIANGYRKGMEKDRKDVNGNYNPENCHFITHKENCAPNKRRLRKTNRTGERNVCPTKNGTFAAYANVNGKQKYIGAYGTISEAAFARDKAEGTIHDNPELMEVR